jgi:predicted nucleotide-binding protein
MSHLLGIDIGTSGTKTLICDEKGKVLATAMAENPIFTPKPAWSEQKPGDWWQSTSSATKAVLKKAKQKPADISGIGLSGQMHGSVFLGDGPKALRPALLWNDQRTAEECREITEKAGGCEALTELVANPALTGFTAPKFLWVRKHEPRVYEKTKHILLPKDYIRYRMTGEYGTDAMQEFATGDVSPADRATRAIKRTVSRTDACTPTLAEIPATDLGRDHETDQSPVLSTSAGQNHDVSSRFRPRKIAIVHGHDEGAKANAARFVERVGHTPIILHEQPNEGRTPIEKIEGCFREVSFAIALLTPDDLGGDRSGVRSMRDLKPRARQNVIGEFMYFIAKLGRDRVCALYKEGVELPTDLLGILYVKMDGGIGWQYELGREMRRAGIQVDLNRL